MAWTHRLLNRMTRKYDFSWGHFSRQPNSFDPGVSASSQQPAPNEPIQLYSTLLHLANKHPPTHPSIHPSVAPWAFIKVFFCSRLKYLSATKKSDGKLPGIVFLLEFDASPVLASRYVQCVYILHHPRISPHSSRQHSSDLFHFLDGAGDKDAEPGKLVVPDVCTPTPC